MIVFNNHDHAEKICKEIGLYFNPRCDICIARVEENGLLRGGVVYTNPTGTSIQVHVAAFDPHWINRDMLWVVFHYPFIQLRYRLLLAPISSANVHALAFSDKFGFQDMARVPGVYPEGDLILRGMRRDECRWLVVKPRGIQEGS